MQTAILRCLSHIAKNEENGIKEFKSGQRHQSNPCKWRKYVVCRAFFFIKSAFGLYLVFTNGTVKTIFYLRGIASAAASIAACAD